MAKTVLKTVSVKMEQYVIRSLESATALQDGWEKDVMKVSLKLEVDPDW